MFSALKKLTRSGDDRCPAPVPMSSSLQKKFSKGVHFNMKILIKGDRNVGKSCLLQRLQGGPFAEEYVPTDQIQVAPIHWTYKNTEHIVKVEVWEVVDKGRTKKKAPLGLKLENSASASQDEDVETPVLDATFLDVYKNATGVIMMFDITKPWTFEYVIKELSQVPADLPVIVLGNHCDMQHHRQVHPHYIEHTIHQAKLTRTAPIRYAESSMRNGFGLRMLHKFLSVPFLRLQKTSLLEQLQRNRKDMEDIEKELDDFQNSEESHYNTFVDRLAHKRRASEPRVNHERSPSIVLGAGKPIVPPDVNPLLAQSLNPLGIKAQHGEQTQYVSPDLMKSKYSVGMDVTPSRPNVQDSAQNTLPVSNKSVAPGAIDDFYAGALDSSFLDDLSPMTHATQDVKYESDSDEENTNNPRVTVDEDDLDVDYIPIVKMTTSRKGSNESRSSQTQEIGPVERLTSQMSITKQNAEDEYGILAVDQHVPLELDADFPLWTRDASARRSPEGGEDPQISKEPEDKPEKKHKKKKSKDKEKESDKSERKEKKHRRKKSRNEKSASNPQQDLLAPAPVSDKFDYDEYDSI